jgi:hypothetical protein
LLSATTGSVDGEAEGGVEGLFVKFFVGFEDGGIVGAEVSGKEGMEVGLGM